MPAEYTPICLNTAKYQTCLDNLADAARKHHLPLWLYGGANYKDTPADLDILFPELDNQSSALVFEYLNMLTGKVPFNPVRINYLVKYSPVALIIQFLDALTQKGFRLEYFYFKKEDNIFVIRLCDASNVPVDIVLTPKDIQTHAMNLDLSVGAMYYSIYDHNTEDPKTIIPYRESLEDFKAKNLNFLPRPTKLHEWLRRDFRRFFRIVHAENTSDFSISENLKKLVVSHIKYTEDIFRNIRTEQEKLRLSDQIYRYVHLLFFTGYAKKSFETLKDLTLLEQLFGYLQTLDENQKTKTMHLIEKAIDLIDKNPEENSISLLFFAIYWEELKKTSESMQSIWNVFENHQDPKIKINPEDFTPEKETKNREILAEIEKNYLKEIKKAEKKQKKILESQIKSGNVFLENAIKFKKLLDSSKKTVARHKTEPSKTAKHEQKIIDYINEAIIAYKKSYDIFKKILEKNPGNEAGLLALNKILTNFSPETNLLIEEEISDKKFSDDATDPESHLSSPSSTASSEFSYQVDDDASLSISSRERSNSPSPQKEAIDSEENADHQQVTDEKSEEKNKKKKKKKRKKTEEEKTPEIDYNWWFEKAENEKEAGEYQNAYDAYTKAIDLYYKTHEKHHLKAYKEKLFCNEKLHKHSNNEADLNLLLKISKTMYDKNYSSLSENPYSSYRHFDSEIRFMMGTTLMALGKGLADFFSFFEKITDDSQHFHSKTTKNIDFDKIISFSFFNIGSTLKARADHLRLSGKSGDSEEQYEEIILMALANLKEATAWNEKFYEAYVLMAQLYQERGENELSLIYYRLGLNKIIQAFNNDIPDLEKEKMYALIFRLAESICGEVINQMIEKISNEELNDFQPIELEKIHTLISIGKEFYIEAKKYETKQGSTKASERLAEIDKIQISRFYLLIAENFKKEKNLFQAIRFYNLALTINPFDFDLNKKIVDALISTRQYNLALEKCNLFLEKTAQSSEQSNKYHSLSITLLKGKILLMKSSDLDIEEAMAIFYRIIHHFQENFIEDSFDNRTRLLLVESYTQLGCAFLKKIKRPLKDCDGTFSTEENAFLQNAEHAFQEACRTDENTYIGYIEIAKIKEARKEFEMAFEQYESCLLKIKNNYAGTKKPMIFQFVFELGGKVEDALIEKIINHEKTLPIQSHEIELLNMAGRFYELAIQFLPSETKTNAHIKLAEIDLCLGRFDDAITKIQHAQQDLSQTTYCLRETFWLLGQSYEMKGRYTLAEENYRKAIQKEPFADDCRLQKSTMRAIKTGVSESLHGLQDKLAEQRAKIKAGLVRQGAIQNHPPSSITHVTSAFTSSI